LSGPARHRGERLRRRVGRARARRRRLRPAPQNGWPRHHRLRPRAAGRRVDLRLGRGRAHARGARCRPGSGRGRRAARHGRLLGRVVHGLSGLRARRAGRPRSAGAARHLTQRPPNARIPAGLWPVHADAVEDDRTGKIVASDVYAFNLKNTVDTFMKAAHAEARRPRGQRPDPSDDGRGRHEAPPVPVGNR